MKWNEAKLQYRFKSHLGPNVRNTHGDTPNIPPLPLNKSVIEVFADFFKYLHRAAYDYIKFYCGGWGEAVWCSVEGDIHFVLSHPNGWAGQQQAKLRKAAVLVQLIPNMAHGYSRISFVTEGEAYLQFAIEHGLSGGVIKVITIVSHMGWCKLTQSSGRWRCYYCWCRRTYHLPERLLLQYWDWHCIWRNSSYPMYVCPHHQCFCQFIQRFKGLFQGSDSASGKLHISFEQCQSDESELKWPSESHLAQLVAALLSEVLLGNWAQVTTQAGKLYCKLISKVTKWWSSSLEMFAFSRRMVKLVGKSVYWTIQMSIYDVTTQGTRRKPNTPSNLWFPVVLQRLTLPPRCPLQIEILTHWGERCWYLVWAKQIALVSPWAHISKTWFSHVDRHSASAIS